MKEETSNLKFDVATLKKELKLFEKLWDRESSNVRYNRSMYSIQEEEDDFRSSKQKRTSRLQSSTIQEPLSRNREERYDNSSKETYEMEFSDETFKPSSINSAMNHVKLDTTIHSPVAIADESSVINEPSTETVMAASIQKALFSSQVKAAETPLKEIKAITPVDEKIQSPRLGRSGLLRPEVTFPKDTMQKVTDLYISNFVEAYI